METIPLSAYANTDRTEITLSWTNTQYKSLWYKVFVANASDGPWTLLDKVNKNTYSYTHRNIFPSLSYFYYVELSAHTSDKTDKIKSNIAIMYSNKRSSSSNADRNVAPYNPLPPGSPGTGGTNYSDAVPPDGREYSPP